MMRTTGYDGIRIYIADLDAYNNGRLVGEWVDLPIDPEDLQRIVQKYSHHGQQDIAIHDHESPFRIGEYDDPAAINDLAEALGDLHEAPEVIEVVMQGVAGREDALRVLEQGEYTVWQECWTLADVARTQAEELESLKEVPEWVHDFIDYDRWGDHLDMEGTLLKGDGFYVEVYS